MAYVERDGIWHIVARTEDAEAVTVCNLRLVQQTGLLPIQHIAWSMSARCVTVRYRHEVSRVRLAALVGIAACVSLSACTGDAVRSVAPSSAAAPSAPTASTDAASCADVELSDDPLEIEVTARSFAFDTERIEGPRACEPFVIVFMSHEGDSPTTPEDRLHDIDIRAENLLGDILFDGELIPPGEIRYEVPGLPAGEHFFYCSNHSDMNGTLVVAP